jgi:RNA-directed DNA polymerase
VTNHEQTVASGLATAMLAGPWEQASMLARTKTALGRRTPPKWLAALVGQVLAAYRDAPADRPRELAAFLQTRPAWLLAWQHRRRPRIVALSPVPTEMISRPWPITELPHLGALGQLLDIDQGELAWFADVKCLERSVAEPLRHYRWTALPKRDGVRLVAAPKPRLKEIQRRLLRHLLEPIPVHPAAHGCVRGRSVRTAVAPHAGAAVVLRADLEAYFPSVSAGRVWSLLRSAGLPEAVAHTVTGLATTVVPKSVWQSLPLPTPENRAAHDRLRERLAVPHLPQGAPTSPALANLVSFSLDRRLAGLAAGFGAQYTRYVDDLTFSGGPSLRRARSRFVDLLDEIVRDEGLRLNEAKTVMLGAAGRQALLGAVVNDHPTVSRPERDALRAILHNCAVHGWRTQVRDRDDFPTHVLGRISWMTGLDPAFGTQLRASYDAIDWS